MNSILNSIKDRLQEISEDTAQAIRESNWKIVLRNAIIAIVLLIGIALLVVGVLALLLKILGSLIGKILVVPVVLLILGLSYKANHEDQQALQNQKTETATLEAWSEDVYEVLRDAVFLVLRTMSDYTVVIRPTSPGAVELPNSISIRDGYAVFTFFARVSGPVDEKKLRQELRRTLEQKLRAHELNGLAADFVKINGRLYCPLQVFDLVDLGDCINFSLVFASEKTISLIDAKRKLLLDAQKSPSKGRFDTLYDDDL